MRKPLKCLYGFGPQSEVLFMEGPRGTAPRALFTDPNVAPYVINLVTGERVILAPQPGMMQ